METLYEHGTPLAAYLEGEGSFEANFDDNDWEHTATPKQDDDRIPTSFAPPNIAPSARLRAKLLPPLQTVPSTPTTSSLTRIHNAWSTAVNSRLGRADNAKFLEHFRYILVASQLLNEYLDQGSLQTGATVPSHGFDGTADVPVLLKGDNSLYGAAAAATAAFALVWLIHWARSARGGSVSKSRVVLVLVVFAAVTLLGYAYIRRQWLKYLRQQAVETASNLTTNWQAFEVSSLSALQFIQEVELVSKGYRLSTPLPPLSRIEEPAPSRRCARLRKTLHKAYAASIPAFIAGINTLRTLINDDDLDRYYDVYDIHPADVEEATGPSALCVLEDPDASSLKSLRLLSYRANILRRVTLCALMSLEADGSAPDFGVWRSATETMLTLSNTTGTSAENLRASLAATESLNLPTSPTANRSTAQAHTPTRDKWRTQARKISALSSGIRSLQAKMQILREETSRTLSPPSPTNSTLANPNTLNPSSNLSAASSPAEDEAAATLLSQYDGIGADLRALTLAWETGRASLAANVSGPDKRVSQASNATSGLRSPVSSLSGLTAVDEDGSPESALRALTGGPRSNRSSLATTPSNSSNSDKGEDESGEKVFEGISLPKQRQRSAQTREERILAMQEERARRTSMMAKREVNSTMMRELEGVIGVKTKGRMSVGGGADKGTGQPGLRVTSV